MKSFKSLRNERGLTTQHVAQKLGIKVTTYRKYECFVRLPSASILSKMADVYKCNTEDILEAYNNAKEVQLERYGRTNP